MRSTARPRERERERASSACGGEARGACFACAGLRQATACPTPPSMRAPAPDVSPSSRTKPWHHASAARRLFLVVPRAARSAGGGAALCLCAPRRRPRPRPRNRFLRAAVPVVLEARPAFVTNDFGMGPAAGRARCLAASGHLHGCGAGTAGCAAAARNEGRTWRNACATSQQAQRDGAQDACSPDVRRPPAPRRLFLSLLARMRFSCSRPLASVPQPRRPASAGPALLPSQLSWAGAG